jgi:nitroreductase
MGMWMQTVMLLLREEGLDSCSQESWSMFPKTVRRLIAIPDDHILFAGMAIGYAQRDAPVNLLRSERAPLSETTLFAGTASPPDIG